MIELHVARTPTCSSVHPPNWALLRHFHSSHSEPRTTTTVEKVQTTTLDAALDESNADCDLLKIDTQGAEYEILEGASTTLARRAVAVVVETWTDEVHAGQRFTWDVMKLMHDRSFSLYQASPAAGWRRPSASEIGMAGRTRLMGLDLLFLKDSLIDSVSEPDPQKLVKLAGIAATYGHYDVALDALAETPTEGLGERAVQSMRNAVASEAKRKRRFTSRIRRKLFSCLGLGAPEYPLLHY